MRSSSNNFRTNDGADSDVTSRPDYRSVSLSLRTVMPSMGSSSGGGDPQYLIYEQKSRSLAGTMFKNTGFSYLIGVIFGGVHGFQESLWEPNSSRFRLQLNSVLNNTGRHASKVGNLLGVISILYSTYEHYAFEVRHFCGKED
jgi:hypothetical protein